MKLAVKRNKIVLLFVSAMLTAMAPTWIARLFNANLWIHNGYSLLTCLLTFALPLCLSKVWPDYASFDKTLLPLRWKQYLWIPVLIIVMCIWSVLAGYIQRTMGYRRFTAVYSNTLLACLNWSIAIVFAPISEELFWRGYALDQFRKISNTAAAIFISAALFWLIHIPAQGTLSLNALGLGIVLGFWRIRNRALLPLMIIHSVFNTLIILPQIISWHRQMSLLP